MSEDVLLVEEENGVVTLTLNRPQVMNSFNFQLLHALKEQIESVRFKRDIRVIIITGAGDKKPLRCCLWKDSHKEIKRSGTDADYHTGI